MRHNNIVKFIGSKLRSLNFQVDVEPRLTTTIGLRIPDIIAKKEDRAYIMDVQVVADSNVRDIEALNNIKMDKYNIAPVKHKIREIYEGEPEVAAITLNWLGNFNPSSKNFLMRRGIRSNNIELIRVKAVQGGVNIAAN